MSIHPSAHETRQVPVSIECYRTLQVYCEVNKTSVPEVLDYMVCTYLTWLVLSNHNPAARRLIQELDALVAETRDGKN